MIMYIRSLSSLPVRRRDRRGRVGRPTLFCGPALPGSFARMATGVFIFELASDRSALSFALSIGRALATGDLVPLRRCCRSGWRFSDTMVPLFDALERWSAE